jgi:outer membrane receptor protein involved in Fe transport
LQYSIKRPNPGIMSWQAGASLLVLSTTAFAQTTAPAPATAKDNDNAQNVVVVTGVLRNTTADKAAISVTTIDEDRMRAVAPVSAADLLTEIPGVVVTSDAGEARNTVYARGISNGTSAGTVGYYWNALMEDGLPVVGGLFSNFSPDMFLRADATTKTVQAVRGGSAAVTGPNAPAGLFNYISKNGLTDPGGMIGTRFGVENNDHPGNLYQKYDFYYGAHNADSTLGWSIGGDYRRSYGYRDIAYPPNRGGQIKANVNKLYTNAWGKGSLQLSLKYLDDHTGYLDIVRPMAHGFGPIAFDTPFGLSSNFIPTGDIAHAIPSGLDGRTDYWDPSNFAHNRGGYIGLKWEHDFDSGWKVNNNFRYQSNQVHHSEAEGISYLSVTSSTVYANLGAVLAGLSTTPGYYTLTDRSTGQVIARVNQRTAASAATGAACSSLCVQTTTPNLLPNSTITGNSPIANSNLVLNVSALNNRMRSDDFVDLFTTNKSIRFADDSNLTVTAGAYTAWVHFVRDALNGGQGVMGLENSPDTYDVTFTTTAAKPVTYQLTNAAGFGAVAGTGGSSVGSLYDDVHTREISPLLGLTWEKDKWLFDFGARYTSYNFHGTNYRYVTNPSATSRSFGGLDGNPLTIYDNVYAINPASSAIRYNKNVHYFQYTGAVNYSFSNKQNVHIRYTLGHKNGDGYWNNYDAQWKVDATDPNVLPVIKQFEIGYTYRTKGFSIEATPYFVDIDRVGVTSYGTLADGVTPYTRPLIYSHYRSYGIEVDNRVRLARWLGVHNVLTLNQGRAISAATWASGCGGLLKACATGVATTPDTAVYTSGPQERAAKVVYNGTLNADFDNFGGYYRFRYIGKRPTTVAALAYLPPNKVSDIGLYYNYNDKLRFDFNVNNLFNDRNATQIGQLGNLPSGMTLDQFIAQYPNALTTVQTNAPRSFFFNATLKF